MKRNEPLSNIMTTDVQTANLADKPSALRKLLSDTSVHHLPVLDGKKLVGMVSSTDMLRLSMASYGADQRAVDAFLDHQFTVEDIMKTDLKTVGVSGTVRDAAVVLGEGRFHSLPVVDDDGALAGLVTSTDLIRYLLAQY